MITSLFIMIKFNFYFITCEFVKEFDNNFTTSVETIFGHNVESNKIKIYLLYYIDCGRSRSTSNVQKIKT